MSLGSNRPGGLPGAGTNGDPYIIPAGYTPNVSISYDVNNSFRAGFGDDYHGPVIVWLDYFVADRMLPTNGGITNAIDCGNTNSRCSSVQQPNSNGSSGYPSSPPGSQYANPIHETHKQNDCPSFYFDYNPNNSETHYFNNPTDHDIYGGAYFNEIAFPTDIGNGPNGLGFHTCGPQGKSIIWSDTGTITNRTYQYSANMAIPTNVRDTDTFCVRGYMSMGIIADEYARTGSEVCYALRLATYSGNVSSNPVSATGRPLQGVRLDITDCGSTAFASTTTDANGNYSFAADAATQGQTVCINPAVPYTGYNTTYSSYNGTNQHVCYSATCTGVNYTLNPDPVPSAPSKITNPSSGTAVVPGQTVQFSVTAPNPIDSNTSVDTVHGEQLDDEIPLNIDPNSVSGISATLSTGIGEPPGWSTNASIPCTGVTTTVNYGYGGSGHSLNGVCGYTPPSGGMPGFLHVVLSTMPAYTQLMLNWAGNVMPAGLVGVYPTNGAYCNNGSVNFGDPNSVFGGPLSSSGCQDFTSGLQGVSNFAYDWIASDMSPVNSNSTYNPIPGQLNCIGKDTNAQTQLGQPLQTGAGACGTNLPAGGDKWVYTPGSAGYGNAQFRILTQPAATMGPVYYSVIDQNDGVISTNTGRPLDPALQNSSGYTGGSQNNGVAQGAPGSQWLWWSNEDSVTSPFSPASYQPFTFQVSFTDQGVGHQVQNTVKACWPRYWEQGYPVSCVNGGMPAVTQQAITNPFVTSSNGDIHAGGGPNNGSCGTSSAQTQPYTRQNPGAAGQYFVTATGPLNGASDKNPFFVSGSSSTTANGTTSYGVVCRPDVVTSTNNYAALPGKSVPYTTSVWSPTSQAALDGKVVVSNGGDVTIPAGTVINSRWTLLVKNGNVNVAGNGTVTVGNAVLNGQPETQHASFGVVLDGGNLSIDKDITELDGFYYVGPDAAGNNGRVNTCAGPDGRPTLESPSPTGAAAYHVADCQKPLVVKGLIMANIFRLNRTTTPGANGTNPAEFVQFDDRLYTATPPGFSNLTQTYLPPLYLPEINSRF